MFNHSRMSHDVAEWCGVDLKYLSDLKYLHNFLHWSKNSYVYQSLCAYLKLININHTQILAILASSYKITTNQLW